MTEAELKLQARLSAIEHCVGTLFALSYNAAGLSLEEIKSFQKIVLEALRSQSLVVGSDPALSDVGSYEICENVERILKGAETLAASALRQSPGTSSS